MKKCSIIICALIFLPLMSMENITEYTSKTMLQAIKEEDIKLFRIHKHMNIEITNDILWAIYATENKNIYDLFLRGSLNLDLDVFNKFVDEFNQKYEIDYNDCFYSFVRKIIGLTGIVPTNHVFNPIKFYTTTFIGWYLHKVEHEAITQEYLERLHENVQKQRAHRKDLELPVFFNVGITLYKTLFFHDDVMKNYYLMRTGNKLTYKALEERHSTAPLIISSMMAIITGNIDIIDYVLIRKLLPLEEILTIKNNEYNFLYNCFFLGYNDVSGCNSSREKFFKVMHNYLKAPQLSTFKSPLERMLKKFKFYNKNNEVAQALFSVLLKIACMYRQVDIAKLLTSRHNIHSETTFILVKDVMENFSRMIKQLRKNLKKIDDCYISDFEILYKDIKEYVFTERLYAKIMKNKHKFKFCKLPLSSESEKNSIVPAEIGLKIIEYCPLVYERYAFKK